MKNFLLVFASAVAVIVCSWLVDVNRVDAHQSLAAPEVPVGTIIAYSGPVTDTGGAVEVYTGWFLCNGVALQKSQYKPIWDVIQTYYGNGSDDNVPATDFNLPDLRGVFLRGLNLRQNDPRLKDVGAASRVFNNPGGNVGDLIGSFQSDAVGRHTHGVTDPGHSHGFKGFRTDGAGAVGQAFPTNSNNFGTESAKTNITINPYDGGESRPRNVATNYLIRVR